jgi:hypothetical protein
MEQDSKALTPRGAQPPGDARPRESLAGYLVGRSVVVMFDWTETAGDADCGSLEGVNSITQLVGSRRFVKPLSEEDARRLEAAVHEPATAGLGTNAAWIWPETVPFGFTRSNIDPEIHDSDVCPQELAAFITFVVVRAPASYYSWYIDETCPCVQQDHKYQSKKMHAAARANRECVYCHGYGTHSLPNAILRYGAGEPA